MSRLDLRTISFDGIPAILGGAAPPRALLLHPNRINFDVFGLAAAGDYNNVGALPGDSIQQKVIACKGRNNLALRGYVTVNSGAVIPGTHTGTVRAWGLAAMEPFPNPAAPRDDLVHRLSGQYLGEVVFGVNTALALPAASGLLPAAATGSSWCDLITVTAGNPHPSFATDFGAIGSGRWLRIRDLLGWPYVFVQWTAAGANGGFNGEYYTY